MRRSGFSMLNVIRNSDVQSIFQERWTSCGAKPLLYAGYARQLEHANFASFHFQRCFRFQFSDYFLRKISKQTWAKFKNLMQHFAQTFSSFWLRTSFSSNFFQFHFSDNFLLRFDFWNNDFQLRFRKQKTQYSAKFPLKNPRRVTSI